MSGGDEDEGLLLLAAKEENKAESEVPLLSISRYWVLLVYFLYATLQCMTWALPGALQPQFESVYGMSQDTVQLCLNYGCYGNLLLMIPSMWALDRFGLRLPVLTCIAVCAASVVLRLFATDGSLASLVAIHASCILSAVAGPLATGCPSKLAEEWFPPKERTLACGVAAMAAQGGSVFVYLMLPLLSPAGDAQGMVRVNSVVAGLGVVTQGLALLHFPALPPCPPSASAGVSRAEWAGERVTLPSLLASARRLFAVPGYTVCVVTYAFTAGLSTCQSGLLTQNFLQVGASEAQAGWVGTISLGAGLVAGIAASRLGDAVKARFPWGLKALLCAFAGCGATAFLLFAVCTQWGWGGFPLACASFAASQMALSAQICLTFEVAAEAVWGLGPEGSMLILLVTPVNAVQLVGFYVPQAVFFPVANWGTAVAAVLSVPMLLYWIPNTSARLEFDMEQRVTLGGGGEGGLQ